MERSNSTMPSSVREDYYAAVFSDPWGLTIYVIPTVLSQTVGSYLLWSLSNMLEENQFASIMDRLLANICRILHFAIHIIPNVVLLRYLAGPFSPGLCNAMNLGAFGVSLSIIIFVNEMYFFRLLFSSVWKNVGMLAEDFVLFFVKVINGTFVSLMSLK